MAATARERLGAALRPMPLFVLLNDNEASGKDAGEERRQRVEAVLAASGRPYALRLVDHTVSLPAALEQTLRLAQAQHGAVVVGGGDGTLSTAARAVLPTGLPFGVLPQGTFNYFAREHGLPLALEDGVRALLDGVIRPVQVGLINGRPFLVNASLGLYPVALEQREALKQRVQRNRAVALAATLWAVLREHREHQIDLVLHEAHQALRLTTLFVGNNALQLESVGVDRARAALQRRQLVALAVAPLSAAALLSLLARGAVGQLADDPSVASFPFTQLTVEPRASRWGPPRTLRVAVDGEVLKMTPPLRFEVSPQPLQLIVPRAGASAATRAS